MEDAIERNAADDDAAALQAEFRERLDAPDIDDDIEQRPVADIIADICRDLGLGGGSARPFYKRRTPADIAALCARAASRPASGGQPPATADNSATLLLWEARFRGQ